MQTAYMHHSATEKPMFNTCCAYEAVISSMDAECDGAYMMSYLMEQPAHNSLYEPRALQIDTVFSSV